MQALKHRETEWKQKVMDQQYFCADKDEENRVLLLKVIKLPP